MIRIARCERCNRLHFTVNGRTVDWRCHCNTRKFRREHKEIVYLIPVVDIPNEINCTPIRRKLIWHIGKFHLVNNNHSK